MSINLALFTTKNLQMTRPTSPKKGSDAALMIEYFATEGKLGDIAGMERVFTVWYPSIVPESHTEKGYYFDSARKNYIRKALTKKGYASLYQGWEDLLNQRHKGRGETVSKDEYDILKIQLAYLKDNVLSNQELILKKLSDIDEKIKPTSKEEQKRKTIKTDD